MLFRSQFIPDGMVCREVPAHKYIVFTHHGKLETLGETYHYIYNTGLAQARVQMHPSRFDFNLLGIRHTETWFKTKEEQQQARHKKY